MKLLFSEAAPDYENYIFPYAIWGFPEPGETPADFLEAGFLPSTRDLDRFYLVRQIRIRLSQFKLSSENRRILRKCPQLKMRLIKREDFELTEERKRFYLRYADARFGKEAMSAARLESLFSSPVATHLIVFEDEKLGTEAGCVVLYNEKPKLGFFYYSFYDLDLFERSLGLHIMTTTVNYFAEAGFEFLYLGTCYSERALYKTQFRGCEFFNGFKWSDDLRELKYLVSRQAAKPTHHLLQTPGYTDAFLKDSLKDLAKTHGFSISR